ncbi:MAG: hypothetical protein WA981_00720, partial [Glaciecola sp.]
YPTLLLSLSYALQIKTGGPAMYANTKVRRMRFSDAKRACNEPCFNDIARLVSICRQHLLIVLLITAGILFCLTL